MEISLELIQMDRINRNISQRQSGEPPLDMALIAEPGYPSMTRIVHRVCSSSRSLLPEPVKQLFEPSQRYFRKRRRLSGVNYLAPVEGIILGTRKISVTPAAIRQLASLRVG